MEVANLLVRISADGKQLSSGLKDAASKLKGLYGLIGGSAAVAYTKTLMSMAEGYDDLHKKTGLSTETLQRWRSALSKGGADLETAITATQFLQKAMVEASEGNEDMIKSFGTLGVSLADIRGKSYDKIFEQIAGAIETMPNTANVTAAALKTLGKGAGEMFAAFREGFLDNAAKARVFSEEFILLSKRYEELSHKMGKRGNMLWAQGTTAVYDMTKPFQDLFAFGAISAANARQALFDMFKVGPTGALKSFIKAEAATSASIFGARVKEEQDLIEMVAELKRTNATKLTAEAGSAPLAPEAPNDPNWKPTITPYNAIPTSPLSSDAFTKVGLFTGARGDGMKAVQTQQLATLQGILRENQGMRIALTQEHY